MSVLFIDSDSDLPFDLVKELGIDSKFVIKMPYTICDKEYFFDLTKEYNAKNFFDLVRQGNMPITSGLNSKIYMDYFEPYFKAGEDILYVSFGTEFSATFKYLDIAITELTAKYPQAKYRRFDTKSISMGTGLLCYYAIKMHNQGKTNDEIYNKLSELMPKICLTFLPSNLFYLKRGGRLTAAAATLGTILQVKPIIRLNDKGVLFTSEKVNGRNKAYKNIVNEIVTNISGIDDHPVVVLNGDCKELSDKLILQIKEQLPNVNIWDYSVGPVIGSHCGPDTIGVIYFGSSRPN